MASTRYVNPELKQKIKKVLSVWKERKVYGSEFIDLLEKKAQLNTIQTSSSLPNDMSHTSEKEENEDNARESDQSFSLPPILKDLSENMKALHENDASKVSAITRVNAIRSKLYQKEDFYSIHEKGQLEVIAGEISNALAHLGNFESMISTEMNTRENIKRGALELLHVQDVQLQSLAAQHRDIMEKQELLKGVAQEIVSKISYGTGGIGGASLFALPSSVAGLNTAATNIHKSPVPGMTTGLGGESDHASMESAAKAAESNLSTTPYQHGVHPATLDRISFSLQQNEDDFEL